MSTKAAITITDGNEGYRSRYLPCSRDWTHRFYDWSSRLDMRELTISMEKWPAADC